MHSEFRIPHPELLNRSWSPREAERNNPFQQFFVFQPGSFRRFGEILPVRNLRVWVSLEEEHVAARVHPQIHARVASQRQSPDGRIYCSIATRR